MMNATQNIDALRKCHYALEALPKTIRIPALGSRREEIVREIGAATLDDVSFALFGLETEFNVLGDRLHALRKLYSLARETGAVGSDIAADPVIKAKGDK